jgi:hypothetical protein
MTEVSDPSIVVVFVCARVSCHWLACLASQHRVQKKLIVSVFKLFYLLKETAAQVLTLQSFYVKRNGNF